MTLPPFIGTWDSGEPGALWDAGLDWDTNVGLSPGTTAAWLALVTSEHADKPKFMATLANVLQPFADMVALLQGMSAAFDVSTAVGAQLDIVGEWVNVSRNIPAALTGVYFSFDTAGVGWDQGTWWNPLSPVSQLTALPDDAYRRVIQLKTAWNQWDGTIPATYTAWNLVFASLGIGLLIQDEPGMHMLYALSGTAPDPVTQGMFLNGLLTPKPAGVQVAAFVTPSVLATPYFGFDVQNSAISGWDTGAWGTLNPGL
jgi:hypothetical protein